MLDFGLFDRGANAWNVDLTKWSLLSELDELLKSLMIS